MRPKFVLSAALTAVLAAGAVTFLERHARNVPPAALAAKASAPVATKPDADVPALPPLPAPVPAAVTAPVATPEERTANIQAEEDRLTSWQMESDPQSLSNILADLNSPEHEIRMAAIQATVQFDDTNAVPVLKSAADKAQDPDEKKALLEAANFLALPDATISSSSAPLPPDEAQAAAQRFAQAEASRQAQIQSINQNAQQGQTAPTN